MERLSAVLESRRLDPQLKDLLELVQKDLMVLVVEAQARKSLKEELTDALSVFLGKPLPITVGVLENMLKKIQAFTSIVDRGAVRDWRDKQSRRLSDVDEFHDLVLVEHQLRSFINLQQVDLPKDIKGPTVDTGPNDSGIGGFGTHN